jgi:hypothetical protein
MKKNYFFTLKTIFVLFFLAFFLSPGFSQVNLLPVEDAFVRGDPNREDENFGVTEPTLLEVRRFNRFAYLKFEIPATTELNGIIESAELWLYGGNSVYPLDLQYHLAENDWSETEVNYNNKPDTIAGVGPVVSLFPFPTEDEDAYPKMFGEFSVDVTTLLEGREGQTVTIMIRHAEDTGLEEENIKIHSKDHEDDHTHPVLVLIIDEAAVSVENVVSNTGLSVYPNPVKGREMFISNSGIASEKVLLQLFSIDGRLVQQENVAAAENISFKLSSELVNGLYILKLTDGASSQSTRIYIAE